MSFFIGIDNGVNGGIVVLDEQQRVVAKLVMPVVGGSKKEYDVCKISEFFYDLDSDPDTPSFVCLEKAQPQFRDGSKQAFKTGFGYGVLQGILSALSIPFEIVAPKTWQKSIFEGLSTEDTKAASALFCQRKWPDEDWRASERCKKVHDGLTDAACMALYCLRLNKNEA